MHSLAADRAHVDDYAVVAPATPFCCWFAVVRRTTWIPAVVVVTSATDAATRSTERCASVRRPRRKSLYG